MRGSGPRESTPCPSTWFLKELFLLGKLSPWHLLLGKDGPPGQLVALCCSHQYNPSIELATRDLSSLVWGPGYHLQWFWFKNKCGEPGRFRN